MTRPESMADVATRRASDPATPLRKPLSEFLDAFYGAEPGMRRAMLEDEPPATIALQERAYLAAATEHLSLVYRLTPPSWVNGAPYFLDMAYGPESHGRAFEAICLAESPVSFRRRFIFTEARPLRRKQGPCSASSP